MALRKMTDLERLEALLDRAEECEPWILGKIPHHFKRCTADENERLRLAEIGAKAVFTNLGTPLFFCQSMIAGAILSGDYDDIFIVTCSQYGKSYVLGRCGLLNAWAGRKTYVAGATANVTDIIMAHMHDGISGASNALKMDMVATGNKIDRLQTSLSKRRIAFKDGGSIEAVTLGDMYGDLSRNRAVGRGGDYIVDEAAMVSEEALAELGRRDFTGLTSEGKSKLVMISNPHRPGYFYDRMTEEYPSERTFILWMDALTAVEEERFNKKQVMESDFAKHMDTRQRYLFCELPTSGSGMFDQPKVEDKEVKGTHFLGVDPAYKGKDNLCIGDIIVNEDGIYVNEIATVQKTPWIDGVTSVDVADTIARAYRSTGAAYVCVDQGQGIWLIEALVNRCPGGIKGVAFGAAPTQWRIPLKHYAAVNARNVRAEMHLDLQSLIEDGKVTFSTSSWDKVKDVMPFITMERQANNKIKVRSKPEIKAMLGKSPDELDAVLLAIHAAILYGTEEDFIV